MPLLIPAVGVMSLKKVAPVDLSNEMDDELNAVDVELGIDVEIVPTNTAIQGTAIHSKQSKQQG